MQSLKKLLLCGYQKYDQVNARKSSCVPQTGLKDLSSGPTYMIEWFISRKEKGNRLWEKKSFHREKA